MPEPWEPSKQTKEEASKLAELLGSVTVGYSLLEMELVQLCTDLIDGNEMGLTGRVVTANMSFRALLDLLTRMTVARFGTGTIADLTKPLVAKLDDVRIRRNGMIHSHWLMLEAEGEGEAEKLVRMQKRFSKKGEFLRSVEDASPEEVQALVDDIFQVRADLHIHHRKVLGWVGSRSG